MGRGCYSSEEVSASALVIVTCLHPLIPHHSPGPGVPGAALLSLGGGLCSHDQPPSGSAVFSVGTNSPCSSPKEQGYGLCIPSLAVQAWAPA